VAAIVTHTLTVMNLAGLIRFFMSLSFQLSELQTSSDASVCPLRHVRATGEAESD
jgi:hypothetical protein